MHLQDLQRVLDWAADEGWNPGLDDAEAFLRADPDGFLMKWVDGAPAAAISVVNHAPDLAFLGLYICAPAFRGQGHGMAVWRAGLAHAGARTIGLDGVPAQQSNYERSGFQWAGETRRLTGRLAQAAPIDTRKPDATDMTAIMAMDAGLQGYARPGFLNGWLSDTETRRTRVAGPGNSLAYATVRRCRQGLKIGPIFAPDIDTALALIADLSDGEEVSVDVPDAAILLREALEAANFGCAFGTARMYRGTPPPAQPVPVQGVATLELG